MGYSNRRPRAWDDIRDYDDQRDRRFQDRNTSRGYGVDYRGYTRGYNIDHEPNYRTEYDTGYTGYGADSDVNCGRRAYGSNRWPSSEADRWETRDTFYGQGPLRSHLRCRDVMTRNVTTCRRDIPIIEVARTMTV